MPKKQKQLFLVIVIALFLFVVSGCSAKTDSENNYKLPLGDSGYLSEIDFQMSNFEYYKNSDGVVTDCLNYCYTEANKTYTISMSARVTDSAWDDKTVKITAGYYDETNKFVALNDGEYIVLSSAAYIENTPYTFTTTSEHYSDVVLKLYFGSSIDTEVLGADATKKELRAVEKQYRNTKDIKINKLSINEGDTTIGNLLVETTEKGNKIERDNESLFYYNTSTCAYTSDASQECLTLSLNYKGGPWQWVIKELGALLNWITQLVGGSYWLGLLILTMLLRTVAWPIYAKSNSYTSNMSAVQPEMEKLNKKYEGKTDQNSKMKQQMEMKALMKKNHVSMWGCLLPFAQMPIFLAVYQVVQRFPLTPIYSEGTNYNFLWTSFSAEYGQVTGDWILAIIVGLTMVASQLITTYYTKKLQKKKQNFYTAKNQQSNKSMLIMTVVMTVMMVVFAWNSAGIAFYWMIGNTYQIIQTIVSKQQEEKKQEKQQLASGRPEGRQ